MSSNKLSRKIRDIERLLTRDTLNATKKAECERALKAYKSDLESVRKNHKEAQRAKKYHLVKFVEKKKTLRKLKKDPSVDNLALYYYVSTFPKHLKYQALFAGEEPATKETHRYLASIYDQINNNELDTSQEFIKSLFTTPSE